MDGTKIVISILLFLSVFSAFALILNNLYANYGFNIQIQNSELNRLMEQIKQNEEKQLNALTRIQNPNIVDKLLGWFDLLTGSAYTIFSSFVFLLPESITMVIKYVSQFLPIPGWLSTLFFGVLFAILGSLILYLISKVRL